MPFLSGLGLANVAGLFALSSLLILILLHFIRPKPRELDVPSLMFFLKSRSASRFFAFLHRFLHDPLIILQALAIGLLALTLAQPFFLTSHKTTGNVVLVIDDSASMQALDGGSTRFERAIDAAKDRLGRHTSIVLAKATPEVALKDAGRRQARSFLGTLTPAATPSNIGEAMVLAGDLLRNEGEVVVLSDFRNTGGIEPGAARQALEAKGVTVGFVTFGTAPAENVGFIDLALGRDSGKALIKNFGATAREVSIKVGDQWVTRTLAPRATDAVQFLLGSGVTTLELHPDDALPVDNRLTVAMPPRDPVKVLLVTNNASVFLTQALRATGEVELTIAEPPIVDVYPFDIVVFHRVTASQLLAGTMDDIADRVKKAGAAAVILAWPNMTAIDFKGLLPVTIDGLAPGGPATVVQNTRFTRDLDFGSFKASMNARPAEGALTLATIGNSSALAISGSGRGKTIYVGFMEEASDLVFSTTYPIFWLELVRELAGRQGIPELNARTGETRIFGTDQKTVLPDGTKVTTAALTLDQAGTYQLPTYKIAANLLDARESDISAPIPERITGAAADVAGSPQEQPLGLALFGLASLFLLLELYALKRRGEV